MSFFGFFRALERLFFIRLFLITLVLIFFIFITQRWIHIGEVNFLQTVGFILDQTTLLGVIFEVRFLKDVVDVNFDSKILDDLSDLLLDNRI